MPSFPLGMHTCCAEPPLTTLAAVQYRSNPKAPRTFARRLFCSKQYPPLHPSIVALGVSLQAHSQAAELPSALHMKTLAELLGKRAVSQKMHYHLRTSSFSMRPSELRSGMPFGKTSLISCAGARAVVTLANGSDFVCRSWIKESV